jgi:hypothetical protein
MKKLQVSKIIALADIHGEGLFGKASISEIDASDIYQANWAWADKHDHAIHYHDEPAGCCGPSDGNPTRTYVKFGTPFGDNIPCCPICQGSLVDREGACLCFAETYRDALLENE